MVQWNSGLVVPALKQCGLISVIALMTACGGGGGKSSSNTSTATATPTVENPVVKNSTSSGSSSSSSSTSSSTSSSSTSSSSSSGTAQNVVLSGTVTYDRVGHLANGGLNYNAISAMPARGVVVQLIGAQNEIIAATVSDNAGNYQFSTKANTQVKVRVLAQLKNTSPTWLVDVADNTNNNAGYVLDGSLVSSGSNAAQVRNLHAPSGWANGSYSRTRAAAPFAILDSIYDGLNLVTKADASVYLPDLHVRWSENNVAASGNYAQGFIGSSMYSSYDSTIYILGKENNDTDEYDRGVIQHELGHYIEDKLSRSESLGGAHNLDSRVDMRVAFGEGWGNAFSAMAGGDSIYRDAMGATQGQTFKFDIEDNHGYAKGWFNERSIHSVLYDIFDSTNDGADTIALGFKPILAAIHSSEYLNFSGLTSIYPSIDIIKRSHPEAQDAINLLMQNQYIFGVGMYGDGETNDADSGTLLPVYERVAPGVSKQVCSNNQWQENNGADVRRYVLLSVPSDGQYTISVKGAANTDPDLRLWRSGKFALQSTLDKAGDETVSKRLIQGTYTLEVYDSANADDDINTGGKMCFSVSLAQG